MFCPNCRTEHCSSATQCPNCSVSLVADAPTEAPDSCGSHVTILESNDTSIIALARGTLDEAGIPFGVQGDETAAGLILGPVMFPACRFLVLHDREADARVLLDQLVHPTEVDSAEPEIG